MGDKFQFCEIFYREPETRCNNLSWSLHHAVRRHYAVGRGKRDRFYFKENNFPCRYTTLTHWLKQASLLAYCLQMFVLIAGTSCLSVVGGNYSVDLTFNLHLSLKWHTAFKCLFLMMYIEDYKKLILRDCKEKLLTDISNIYLEFA